MSRKLGSIELHTGAVKIGGRIPDYVSLMTVNRTSGHEVRVRVLMTPARVREFARELLEHADHADRGEITGHLPEHPPYGEVRVFTSWTLGEDKS